MYKRLLSAYPTETDSQFNLALSLLASGHGETGIVEYERACAAAEARTDRRRRRGLLLVALLDLEDAIECGAVPPQGAPQHVHGLLAEQLRLTVDSPGPVRK